MQNSQMWVAVEFASAIAETRRNSADAGDSTRIETMEEFLCFT